MKNKLILIFLAMLVIAVIGYGFVTRKVNTKEDNYAQKSISVDILKVENSKNARNVVYMGTVRPMYLEKIAFPYDAKLEELNGLSGDVLKDGEQFIKLSEDDVYKFMLSSGQVPPTPTDVPLDDKVKAMLKDATTYVCDGERVVVKTMFEVGDYVPKGHPVAIVRDNDKKVVIGVTGDDKKLIKKGKKVLVQKDGVDAFGKIMNVSDTPNTDTFLYDVNIDLGKSKFAIGDIVDCKVRVGSYDGIKVPITCVLKGKVDYVYVCDDENIVRIKRVNILDEYDGQFIVDGLKSGDKVIVSNMSKINENDEVIIND